MTDGYTRGMGHDAVCGLLATVDLVNTTEEIAGEEGLPDVAALREFLAGRRFEMAAEATPDDLPPVRALRAQLWRILRAPGVGEAVAMVNTLIAGADTTPRLVAHDGRPWHMHYFAPGAALVDHIGAECGMALAFALAGDDWGRFRECESADCQRLLVDLSRNRSKRYCDSRTCGNRQHVAAYRERLRSRVRA